MRASAITVHYNVKRVSHYQSAEIGASVEVQVAEGEHPKDVFDKTMKILIPLVENEADAAIKQAVYLDSQAH